MEKVRAVLAAGVASDDYEIKNKSLNAVQLLNVQSLTPIIDHQHSSNL